MLEIDVIHTRQDGVKVTIDGPKEEPRVWDIKRHLEQYENRIRSYRNEEMLFTDIKEIFYIDTVDGKTFLYTENDVREVKYRIYELEETLAGKGFVRISKSQIANIRRMKNLRPQLNRSLLVTMENNECLQVSRRYAQALKQEIGIGGTRR